MWSHPGWDPRKIAHGRHEHTYYVVEEAAAAPTVMLMHEFPGIGPSLTRLADALAPHFRLVVPSIVGRDGSPTALRTAAQLCVRREVHALRTGTTSPAVPWLRELLTREVPPGERCGVIGMCMTGGFALAVAVEPSVAAAVVCQPAVPLARGSVRRAADLGLDAADEQSLLERAGTGPDQLCVRGYRFRDDRMSPAARMATAQRIIGSEAMPPTDPLTEPTPDRHSTITTIDVDEYDPSALVAEVVAFLDDRLGG